MYGSTWYMSVIQSCVPMSLSPCKFLVCTDCDLNVAVSPAASSLSSGMNGQFDPKGRKSLLHTLCPAPGAKFLKFEQASEFSVGLVKTQITGPHSRVSDSGGLTSSIFNNFLGEAGPGHHEAGTGHHCFRLKVLLDMGGRLVISI